MAGSPKKRARRAALAAEAKKRAIPNDAKKTPAKKSNGNGKKKNGNGKKKPAVEKKMGRPTKRTEQRVEFILTALAGTATKIGACTAASIDETTLRLWILNDENDDSIEPEQKLGRRVQLAIEASEAKLAALVMASGRTDWRAAAWMLERRFPNRWGKVERVEHSGQIDSGVSDEDRIARVASILESARNRKSGQDSK